MNTPDIEVFVGTGRRQDRPLGHGPDQGQQEGLRQGPAGRRGTSTRAVRAFERAWPNTLSWWVDQPATIGSLAVAVARDMGAAAGRPPGLSMRRIADLTPGAAQTDARDAAVIARPARTMPHTLGAVDTGDEDAAASSMLTGFDLDPAGRVNRTEGWIRVRAPGSTPPWRQSRGPGRGTMPFWRPVAARRRPTRRAGSSPRAPSGPTSPPGSRPWCGPTLMREVLTTRAGCRGRGRSRLPGRDPGQDLRHRRPAGLLRRPDPGHTPLRLIDPRRARLPHRQQETQTRHVPVRLRLPERSRLPRLLPAQTGPGQAPWARPCSPWPTAASSPCTP